ncbi:MAG: hypothetical protein AB1797_06615 [bacterium]
MLDARCSILDARSSTLNAGCSMLDARSSTLDARCSMLVKNPVSRIEHRGSRIEHRICAFVAE